MLLYFRMVFIMAVNLYTSRVILQALGVEDYGIYNVVGGFVAMFSLLSSSLSAAITRFITFELGTGNKEKLNRIFSTSLSIQIALSLIIIILIEIVGVWFVNNKMVIEPLRLVAANWVLQLSMITFCLNLISVPYNALIIAHEKMSAFAYISILDATLKLAVCFLVIASPVDKLISYSILLTIVAFAIRSIYAIYCSRHFEESKFYFYLDKELFYRMFAFSGWNFIGAGSGVLRDQGVNILLNLFWGTTVNAARGIAMQVSAAVTSFSSSFITAINPQITKRYASGDKQHTFSLVIQGARLSYYLLLFLSLPVVLETPLLLKIWLSNVPDYTVIFVRLILLYVMIESISYTMMTLMLATGSIRNYQIIVGGLQLLNFPFAYLLLYFGCQPEMTTIVSIIIAFVCLFVRLHLLNKISGLPIADFVKKVVLNITVVTVIGSIVPLLCVSCIDECYCRLAFTIAVSYISLCATYYFIGCSDSERMVITNQIKKRFK